MLKRTLDEAKAKADAADAAWKKARLDWDARRVSDRVVREAAARAASARGAVIKAACEMPPSLVLDSTSEAQAAFPAPEDSAVQPLKKARRWRAHTLLVQPLAQPTSRPLASFALPLAAVQGDMLP